MDRSDRQTVEQFLEVFHGDEAPDATALSEFMTSDAVYWSLVPSAPRLQGVAAIAEGIAKQFNTYRDCECEIHAIADGDGVVFTERTDHVVLNSDDRRVSARISAVFDIAADGKIASWREYWDSDDVIAQMGVDRAALENDLG